MDTFSPKHVRIQGWKFPTKRTTHCPCLSAIQGVHCNETFAPVVALATIRMILTVVSHHDVELEQIDVVIAILNCYLQEEIHMTVPEVFKNSSNTNMVCKLLKSLFGLKQAPRQCYAKMDPFLVKNIGFTSGQNDLFLYVPYTDSSILIIFLYVDNLRKTGATNLKSRRSRRS